VDQYLAAGLVDELRLHVAPVLLDAGERLFEGVGSVSFEPLGARQTRLVTHLSYRVHASEQAPRPLPCGNVGGGRSRPVDDFASTATSDRQHRYGGQRWERYTCTSS
jgi:hypothetical protein